MRRGGSSSNALPGSCVASSCSLPLFFCFSFFAASRLRVKNIGRTRLPALTLTAEHRLTSLKTEYWLLHSRVVFYSNSVIRRRELKPIQGSVGCHVEHSEIQHSTNGAYLSGCFESVRRVKFRPNFSRDSSTRQLPSKTDPKLSVACRQGFSFT